MCERKNGTRGQECGHPHAYDTPILGADGNLRDGSADTADKGARTLVIRVRARCIVFLSQQLSSVHYCTVLFHQASCIMVHRFWLHKYKDRALSLS